MQGVVIFDSSNRKLEHNPGFYEKDRVGRKAWNKTELNVQELIYEQGRKLCNQGQLLPFSMYNKILRLLVITYFMFKGVFKPKPVGPLQ